MSNVWYSASGSSNILKPTYINGFLDVSSVFLTRSDASMAGNVYIGGAAGLNVNNSMTMSGVINQLIASPMIGNVVTVGGNVSNDSYLGGRLYVSYDASINGRLFVTQDASFTGNLFIGGSNTTINGDASLNSSLKVGGDVAINGNLTANYPNSSIPPSAIIGGVLTGIFTNDISANSSLKVGGDASLNGRLYVAGDASFGGSINVTRDLNVAGSLNVKQYSTNLMVYTVSYELIVASDMSLNGRLFLYDDASMNKKLFVGGDVSMGGKLFTAGDASMNTKLFVGGDVSMGGKFFTKSDVSLNGILTVGGAVNISDPTVSTTTTTGALKVNGGVGIVGNLNVGGNVTLGTASNTVSIPGKLIQTSAAHIEFYTNNLFSNIQYYNSAGTAQTSANIGQELYYKFITVKSNLNWGTPTYNKNAGLYVPYTGIYYIQFSPALAGNRESFISKNGMTGGDINNVTYLLTSGGYNMNLSLSCSTYMSANEYINIAAYCGGDAPLGIRSAFSVTLLQRTA